MAEKYESVLGRRREIFLNNLIGGIAWGIGATIGLALLIGILGLIVRYINLVPVVGSFVSDVVTFVISKNPSL